ncbi:MAG TPA: FHA domain-containing protein, partial [Candidatus Polarisedimenticolia bacterium]
RHARIVLEGGRFALSEESGVLNGTFINGRRLTPGESVPVQGGDKLGFGNITLVFKSPEKAGRRRF